MNMPVGAGFACPNAPTNTLVDELGGQTPPLRLNERTVFPRARKSAIILPYKKTCYLCSQYDLPRFPSDQRTPGGLRVFMLMEYTKKTCHESDRKCRLRNLCTSVSLCSMKCPQQTFQTVLKSERLGFVEGFVERGAQRFGLHAPKVCHCV